jgi:hypothetical protein
MTDITPEFNGLLKQREAPAAGRRSFSLDNLDEFLREAYKIVSIVHYTAHEFNINVDTAAIEYCIPLRGPEKHPTVVPFYGPTSKDTHSTQRQAATTADRSRARGDRCADEADAEDTQRKHT